MSVEHFHRNPTISLPVDVSVFSGTTEETGDASNLSLRVLALDNGYTLDNTDGIFRLTAAEPTVALTAFTNYAYTYTAVLTPGTWPRGNYRAITRDSVSDNEWQFDFTIGLFVPRQLGFSTVYDGTNLSLSLWVEENGIVQTDYISLTSCNMLDCNGNVISGGAFANNTSPNNGVFTFQQAISLQPISNYIFSCIANVAGPATVSNYSFPMRIGIARP